MKPSTISSVLKNDLKLKYKKYSFSPHGSNSDQSKRLRMEFAMKFIYLIKQAKRIINVDQTPIGDNVFVTKGWMPKSAKLSTNTHFIKPRITM